MGEKGAATEGRPKGPFFNGYFSKAKPKKTSKHYRGSVVQKATFTEA